MKDWKLRKFLGRNGTTAIAADVSAPAKFNPKTGSKYYPNGATGSVNISDGYKTIILDFWGNVEEPNSKSMAEENATLDTLIEALKSTKERLNQAWTEGRAEYEKYEAWRAARKDGGDV